MLGMDTFLFLLSLLLGSLSLATLMWIIRPPNIHLAQGSKPYRKANGQWVLTEEHRRKDQIILAIAIPICMLLAGGAAWLLILTS